VELTMANGKVTRKARDFGERVLEDNDETEETPAPAEPTIAEERRRVVRIARNQYSAQLIPWKVAAAAMVAGLFVTGQHWSPWGALPWMFAIAVASFLFTEWRLGGRHIKSGRFDWGNPRGRKQLRVRQRALRSAIMGGCVGGWLIFVTIAAGSHTASLLVWLAGAAVWATFSAHGWWLPAEAAQHTESDLAVNEEDDDEVVVVQQPAAYDRAASRPRRGGIPTPRATEAQATAAAVKTELEKLVLPGTDLLKKSVPVTVAAADDRTAALQKVLDDFHIDAKVVGSQRGPATTRYGIKPGPGQTVGAIKARKDDFALACGTQTIVMHSPIEGQSLVGVEVPNVDREWNTVAEILESREARRDPHPLLVPLGKDFDGNPVLRNLKDGPHWLIAGATESGKSSVLNSMLVGLLTRATPDEVRLLLVDPKKVELTPYEGIPHLLMPVVTKDTAAIDALAWVVDEMDNRYEEMKQAGVRHIDDLNHKIIIGEHKAPLGVNYVLRPKPYLIVVIDEFADLLMVAKDELEDHVVRIGQLARACGIHLVLATQRPAVEVVTAKIKANVPGRIGLATASLYDSRTIIDGVGCEKLLGKGDAILKMSGMAVNIRFQGCLTEDVDVHAVVNALRAEVAKKNIAIPQIRLSEIPRDDKPVQGRATAYDNVLAAAHRHVGDDGLVTKDAIRGATPGLTEATRNAALTRLFDAGELIKLEGKQAVFRVPQPGEKPLNQEEEQQ
jgi:DNA segregation ATPase FtsK/SpoIIIE-like protein